VICDAATGAMIKGGRYDGAIGTVDSVVFQRTDDQPNESATFTTLSWTAVEW